MIYEYNWGFKRNVFWEIKEKYFGCNNFRIYMGLLKIKFMVIWIVCVRCEVDGEFFFWYNIIFWSMFSK